MNLSQHHKRLKNTDRGTEMFDTVEVDKKEFIFFILLTTHLCCKIYGTQIDCHLLWLTWCLSLASVARSLSDLVQ